MSRTKRRAGSPSAASAFSTFAFPVPAPAFPITALIVAAGLLVAAIPAAYGQDATPAAGQSANPSSPASGSGARNKGSQGTTASADVPNGSPAGSGLSAQAAVGAPAAANAQVTAEAPPAANAQAAAGAQATAGTQANGADKSGKPPAVCFKLTGHCVDGSKAPAAKSGTAGASKNGAAAPMNLTAPDVRTVVSADELKEPLPTNEQITETQEADTVSIKGEGVPTDVPVGFGAIWWALNHPSQAWRIVTPYE